MKVKELVKRLLDCNQELDIGICFDNEDPSSVVDIVSVGACYDGPNSYYGLCAADSEYIYNDSTEVNSN